MGFRLYNVDFLFHRDASDLGRVGRIDWTSVYGRRNHPCSVSCDAFAQRLASPNLGSSLYGHLDLRGARFSALDRREGR